VPNVRRARFHKESLPSLLGLPGGGEPAASSGWVDCDISHQVTGCSLFLNNGLVMEGDYANCSHWCGVADSGRNDWANSTICGAQRLLRK
jgi:hypothetical protein